MNKEPLSKPLFVKKKIKKKIFPRSSKEILREAQSSSKVPDGEPNYWGADKTLWRKK